MANTHHTEAPSPKTLVTQTKIEKPANVAQ